MTAKKLDAGKSAVHLVPPELMLGAGDAMGYGANHKYSEYNWTGDDQGPPLSQDRVYASLMRHLLAFRSGERVDKDTELPHLSHAAANLGMLMSLASNNYTAHRRLGDNGLREAKTTVVMSSYDTMTGDIKETKPQSWLYLGNDGEDDGS